MRRDGHRVVDTRQPCDADAACVNVLRQCPIGLFAGLPHSHGCPTQVKCSHSGDGDGNGSDGGDDQHDRDTRNHRRLHPTGPSSRGGTRDGRARGARARSVRSKTVAGGVFAYQSLLRDAESSRRKTARAHLGASWYIRGMPPRVRVQRLHGSHASDGHRQGEEKNLSEMWRGHHQPTSSHTCRGVLGCPSHAGAAGNRVALGGHGRSWGHALFARPFAPLARPTLR